MADLWHEKRQEKRRSVEPLAARMRPRTLEEFAGQEHILGPGKLLRRMIDADRLTSVILSGPPGTGKTTLAEVIARHTNCHFVRTNASAVGVKEIRTVMEEAVKRLEDTGRKTILFLDEIHRFARNQQDVLLDHVERGLIILIGATTENPFFSINSALVSRSTVFRLDPLSDDDIAILVRRALTDERAFPGLRITVDDDAIALWARKSDGDARRALMALEIAVLSEVSHPLAPGSAGGSSDNERVMQNNPPAEPGANGGRRIHISLSTAEESIQQKAPVYDGTGDQHYDVISAFIKSMRGSDPDATVYWLARMLDAGEDPRFIARRIAILASEDIGNADPLAIQVAAAAWEITEKIGMPEAQHTLAQASIYMACAPKSNASAKAIWTAMDAVKENRTIEVPIHIRDRNSTVSRTDDSGVSAGPKTALPDKTGKMAAPGADSAEHPERPTRKYLYPHDAADGYVVQDYLGVDRVFYEPTSHGVEARIRERLNALRERIRAQSGDEDGARGGED